MNTIYENMNLITQLFKKLNEIDFYKLKCEVKVFLFFNEQEFYEWWNGEIFEPDFHHRPPPGVYGGRAYRGI